MIIVLPTVVLFQTTFLSVGPLMLTKFPATVPISIGGAIICIGTFISGYSHYLW
jgi:hypothetical protein